MSVGSFPTKLARTKSVRSKIACFKFPVHGTIAVLRTIVAPKTHVTWFARLLATLRIALAGTGSIRTTFVRIATIRMAPVRTAPVLVASICTAFVCTAFIGIAYAERSGKVVEYGIYSDDHKLLQKTTIIPIKDGVRFGFCFEANIDFSEDRYMLVETLAHPPVQAKDSGEHSGYSVPRMFEVRDGVAHGCSGYRARDVSDLRPGVWKFTISDGEEELVVQEFSIR